MKKLLLKSMLLLSALIVGSGTVWAKNDTTTLPFSWEGGTSSELLKCDGVTAEGLGSDYAASHDPYRIKFDTTGDYIQIHTDDQPGQVTIGVKMIGGNNTSYIVVKGSENGTDFTEIESLTISGTGSSVHSLKTTNSFASTHRYVRLEFTKGSNVGVGPISIAVAPPAAPTFSVNAGTFNSAFDLTITAATGCTLKYTTDGSTPGTSGTAIAVASNTTIVNIPAATIRVRAIAIKAGVNSTETDATYTYVDTSKETPTFTLSPTNLTLEVGEEGTITLTTNSDGDISFVSSDPTNLNVDNSENPKVAKVSSAVAGHYTITVTAATSSTFNERSALVTVDVNKKSLAGLMTFAESTPSINLYDTKTYEQEVSGLPADFASSGGAVSYTIESTVASISGSIVSASNEGVATITASATGSSLYDDYDISYTLTITNTLPAGVMFVETFDKQGASGSFNTSNCDNSGWTSSGSAYQGSKAVRLATGSADGSVTTPALNISSYGKVTIVAKGWSSTEKGALTLTGINCTLETISITDIPNTNTEYNVLFAVTGSNPKITFKATAGNRTYIDNVIVRYADYKASVSSVKYATFCDGISRNFSGSSIKVYKALATIGSVRLEEITDGIVPANTGVILYSETAQNDVAIPVATTDGAGDFSDNELIGINVTTKVAEAGEGGKTNYIFANGAKGVGFYKATATGAKLGAHKAYLSTDAIAAARDFLGFEDEATGISKINNSQLTIDNEVYDLQGRKVTNPACGLYIMNGKKVVIK